jgi:hypothetical protein
LPSIFSPVCSTIYLKNLTDYNSLRGCSTIEGSLIITTGLMDPNLDSSGVIDLNMTFPELREITDYVVVYKANKLRRLTNLFPNLSVIRGNKLLMVREKKENLYRVVQRFR